MPRWLSFPFLLHPQCCYIVVLRSSPPTSQMTAWHNHNSDTTISMRDTPIDNKIIIQQTPYANSNTHMGLLRRKRIIKKTCLCSQQSTSPVILLQQSTTPVVILKSYYYYCRCYFCIIILTPWNNNWFSNAYCYWCNSKKYCYYCSSFKLNCPMSVLKLSSQSQSQLL